MERSLIARFSVFGREPVLAKMPDGSLICTALTGGPREPDNDNVVTVVRSTDGGRTWSAPQVLFDRPGRGTWCTEIFSVGGVPTAVVSTYLADTMYHELETGFSTTPDSGRTWTVPKSPAGPLRDCSLRRCIELQNGDLLLPLYWMERPGKKAALPPPVVFGEDNAFRFCCGAGLSTDGGRTWQRFGYIEMGDVSLWEPNAIERAPGEVLMFCRCDRDFLALSRSTDGGRTWDAPRLTEIPNVDTKITVVRAGGEILLIGNFARQHGWENRTHLGIWRLIDDCHAEPLLALEPEEERFFYPHALVDEDERVLLVAYENAAEHRLARVSFDELGL